MLQRHVLLHGVVEAVLLLPCTPRTLLQFIGTPTQRAQASLHCWLAGLLQATSRPRPITFYYTNTRAHSLNRRTHCFVPLPTHSSPRTTSPSPTVAVDHRAPQPPNYVLSPIGAASGGSDTRASSTLSPHSATVTLATAVVAPFGARLRQIRRDF